MLHNIRHYSENGYDNIPNKPGVYFIKVPVGFTVNILTTSIALEIGKSGRRKGKNLLYDREELKERYQRVIEKNILYIGKADNLRQRIRQYVNAGCTQKGNHYGGRSI